jgi:hypothetical protein
MTASVFAAGALFVLIAFVLFDRVLRFQFENFHTEWETQGKAIGFFWLPEGSSIISGSLQRGIRLLSWTFAGEEWMKNEPTVKRTVWIMRGCIFGFWVSFVPFLYFGFAAK